MYMYTGKEMKLDVGTQSLMQNTNTIFSLTLFNVLTPNVKNFIVKVSSFPCNITVSDLRRNSM